MPMSKTLAELQWELAEAHSDLRFEILRGQVVVVMNPATTPHDRAARDALLALVRFAPDNLEPLGAGSGIWLSQDKLSEWCQPDAILVPKGIVRKVNGPDVPLAVEVISPTNRRSPDYRDAVAERGERYGIGRILFIDTELEPAVGGLDLRTCAAADPVPHWLTETMDYLSTQLWPTSKGSDPVQPKSSFNTE